MRQSLVICDGNPVHLLYLKQTIEDYDTADNFKIETFSEGGLFDQAIGTVPIDIAFLDMSMAGANSIYLGRRIRGQYPEAKIILMTESTSFEVGVYELQASYYLAKPVMAHKIQSILDEVSTSNESRDVSSVKLKWFSIETKKRTVRVAFEDIIYIEKDQRKVVVHTLIGSWDFYGTFKEVRELLDMDQTFVQCHQGFIVNIHRVSVLEPDGLKLTDETWIPVSRRFRPSVENIFEKSTR